LQNFFPNFLNLELTTWIACRDYSSYNNVMLKKLLVTVVLTLTFILPTLALAETAADQKQSLILQLQEQIETLQSQITALSKQTEVAFSRVLQRGASGEEVKKLQTFLSRFPDIYPEGLVTGYYGQLTENAVRKFQEKQGLETVGNVGPKTLSKLNELVTEGAGSSGTIPPGLLTAPGIKKKIETSATTASSTGATPSGTPVVLSVNSTPSGATVTNLDSGYVYCQSTPCNVDITVPPNSINIRVSKSGYSDWTNQVYLYSGQTTNIGATLVAIQPSVITPTGICQVRNSATNIVSFFAPDVGAGYAKIAKPGAKTVTELRNVCTQSDYNTLITSYCRINSSPVKQEVVTYNEKGEWLSIDESAFGNSPLSCPVTPVAPSLTNASWVSLPTTIPPRLDLRIKFTHLKPSDVQSFNVYLKFPNSSSYTKFTYAVPNPSSSVILGDGTMLTRDSTDKTNFEWFHTDMASQPAGSYEIFVTATGNGGDSPQSNTFGPTLIDAPIISTPSNNGMVSSLPFTIKLSDAQSGLYRAYFIFKSSGDLVWSYSSLSTSETTATFNGSNLFTAGQYRILVDSYDDPSNPGSTKQKYAESTFTYSPSTTTSSLNPRTSNLSAIHYTLNSIKAIVEKLSKLLK